MSPRRNECSTYEEAYKKSLECPEEFWGEIGGCIDWSKPWQKVLDNSNEPFTKWYLRQNYYKPYTCFYQGRIDSLDFEQKKKKKEFTSKFFNQSLEKKNSR